MVLFLSSFKKACFFLVQSTKHIHCDLVEQTSVTYAVVAAHNMSNPCNTESIKQSLTHPQILCSHIHSLCKSVQKLLNQYGSSIIKELKFRENYVLVGEKALPGNFGFEKVGYTPCHVMCLHAYFSRNCYDMVLWVQVSHLIDSPIYILVLITNSVTQQQLVKRQTCCKDASTTRLSEHSPPYCLLIYVEHENICHVTHNFLSFCQDGPLANFVQVTTHKDFVFLPLPSSITSRLGNAQHSSGK